MRSAINSTGNRCTISGPSRFFCFESLVSSIQKPHIRSPSNTKWSLTSMSYTYSQEYGSLYYTVKWEPSPSLKFLDPVYKSLLKIMLRCHDTINHLIRDREVHR